MLRRAETNLGDFATDAYRIRTGADIAILQENGLLDNQATIEYIKEDLGGKTGDEYADPYGQGRIVIKQ